MGQITTGLLCLVLSGVIVSYEAASVCYTLAGSSGDTCFNDDPPFDNANNHLPKSPADIGTIFRLYTRGSLPEQIFTDNLSAATRLQTRDTKIIIHGFNENENVGWILKMVKAFLGVGDFNVIVVDWSKGARGLKYNQAVANTRLVGAQVGLLLKALEKDKQISPSKVHIVGLSLGAHVAGYAGKAVPGVARISGLDPAGPCFYADQPQVRLTKKDANYVDVVHTNGGKSLSQGYGIFQAIGTSNFYANGGKSQTGCSNNICSHLRAADLYTESLKGICKFSSYPCDPDSVCDTCGSKGCARMGYYSQTDGASGSYYLTTTGAVPFC